MVEKSVIVSMSNRALVLIQQNDPATVSVPGYCDDFHSFLANALVKKQADRATGKELLNHEFMTRAYNQESMKHYLEETNRLQNEADNKALDDFDLADDDYTLDDDFAFLKQFDDY